MVLVLRKAYMRSTHLQNVPSLILKRFWCWSDCQKNKTVTQLEQYGLIEPDGNFASSDPCFRLNILLTQ